MSLWVPPRSYEAELMDQPNHTQGALKGALRDIRFTNRWLGGCRVWMKGMRALAAEVPATQPIKVLDVGTGEADLPRAWVQQQRAQQRPTGVTAIDADPVTAKIAKQACAAWPEISVEVGDAFDLPYADQSFDIVTASMFLHHFDEPAVTRLLNEFLRLASMGVVIHDLFRHRLAWAGIKAFAYGTWRSAMYRHDAPLSVLRGFTDTEFAALCEQSHAQHYQVSRHWPFRILAVLNSSVESVT